jgi:hypothetical protein
MPLRLSCIVLVLAAAAAAAPVLAGQQNPDSTPTSTQTAIKPTASATASATPASETDDSAALIAQANATAAANAKAEAASAAPAVMKEPSAAARKKAREYGFHAEIYDGKTMFCRDDATLGTRIPAKRCMDSADFEDYGRMLQIARDMMKAKNQCQGGGICGGLQ